MKKISIFNFIVVFILLTPSSIFGQETDSLQHISLLALGDVNLGRWVGQEILKGKTDYPFQEFGDVLERGDIVFANLECPVTDQDGETQSPKSNIVFCAPPQASHTLRRAGITIVSTANNHAFDYGVKGLYETTEFLKRDSILYIGTVIDSGAHFHPAIIEHNGLKLGFVAYTQTVNMIRGKRSGLISIFDSARAQSEIYALKPIVDFIIASYHGGDEYKDLPGKSAEKEMKLLAEFGADIVLGHHSHVPQGIHRYSGSLVFYSLGNAVFYQPKRLWTRRSFAALLGFKKGNGRKGISSIELIPFRPGFQLKSDLDRLETEELIHRIQKLSTVSITHTERGYFVEPSIIQTP